MPPVRVAVVTNVVPHYRQSFYEKLLSRHELDIRLYCQERIPGMDLRTAHSRLGDRVRLIRAHVWPRERLGWQWLPWGELLRDYDVIFVYANPRILSNVCFASWAALRGRKVVLWGPARSAGAGGIGARMRFLWWRQFHALFVYTDREAEWLRARGFRRYDIVGMNNGLDQDAIDRAAREWTSAALEEWRTRESVGRGRLILSCARLEPKNDFALWLQAMPEVLRHIPDLLWCVIGAGPEERALRALAERLGVAAHVRWIGTVLDEPQLAPWFLSASALMHPSGVGLSLLHAFGYGLPVITHDDPAGQMPEFGALTPGVNGVTYRRGSAADLASATIQYVSDPERRRALSQDALRVAREEYNVGIMVDRFVEMALRAATPGRGQAPVSRSQAPAAEPR